MYESSFVLISYVLAYYGNIMQMLLIPSPNYHKPIFYFNYLLFSKHKPRPTIHVNFFFFFTGYRVYYYYSSAKNNSNQNTNFTNIIYLMYIIHAQVGNSYCGRMVAYAADRKSRLIRLPKLEYLVTDVSLKVIIY